MLKFDAYRLKWMAIIAMILNHMAIAWWAIMPMGLKIPFITVGGIVFPIMAYFVAEGYKHTSDFRKYITRILIFAVIAQPAYLVALIIPMMSSNAWDDITIQNALGNLNIMFSIALSLIVLKLYDKIKSRVLFWLLYVLVITPIATLFFEWFFFGTTMVLLYYIIKNEKARRMIPPIFVGLCWFGMIMLMRMVAPDGAYNENIFPLMYNSTYLLLAPTFALGCIAAIPLLLGYNGERGKRMKWLFYTFYPTHLFLLAVVALFFGLLPT